MHPLTAALIGLGILAICGCVVLFLFRRGKGELQIRGTLGELVVKGENPPPPAAVAAGVKIGDAEAGRDIAGNSKGPGGVDIEKAKAGRDIRANSTQDGPPPKKA